MLEVKSFCAQEIDFEDDRSFYRAVESVTEQADDYICGLEMNGWEVKVISTSTNLQMRGNYSAYTLLMVLELFEQQEPAHAKS